MSYEEVIAAGDEIGQRHAGLIHHLDMDQWQQIGGYWEYLKEDAL